MREQIIQYLQLMLLQLSKCSNETNSKFIIFMQNKAKLFLLKNKQNENFNQYWYSEKTIAFLANQALKNQKCCFLSTPSIYYAIDNPQHQQPLYLFDFDQKFAKANPNYFQYDFHHPQNIPEQFHNYFDFVLADPPFITEEVWQKYAEAIKKIVKKDQNGKVVGKILLSTIQENSQFLTGLLGVSAKQYKPSIPHLVYQYCLYSNYQDEDLDKINQEIGE